MVRGILLRTLACAGALLACFVACSVHADDIVIPTWRGDEGSTVQSWDFLTSGVYNFMTMRYEYDAPDGEPTLNPYDVATMEVWPGLKMGGYAAEWGDRTGVWDSTMEFEAEIPNSRIPNPYKEIWVQITWAADLFSVGYPPSVSVIVDPCYTVSDAELIEQIDLGPTGEPDTTPWYLSVYRIYAWENPPLETVQITGPISVDQIVIDTICTVPEPATLSLLGLGGVAILLRWRRKR